MSSTRTRRKVVPRRHTRREVLTAIGGALAVVLGTILLIWLLRPGPSGVEGTGGLASRQPRAAWLVALTLAAVVAFTWWALRRQESWRGKLIIVLVVGWVILGLGAVLAGILWPGGLLRHTEPVPDVADLTPTTLPPGLQTTIPEQTTLPGQTTVPAGTDTNVPPPTPGAP
jgi:UDP-N-acetylmuramyl pentapeptide phosphotransferase/UDP-N-acetylglucosamine-1-phosphate transferase